MVNNFCRDNVAKLTFGDLNSEITSSGIATTEVSLAFTPTTLAALERTFAAFGESAATNTTMENDAPSAEIWDHSTSFSGLSECSDDSEDTSNSMDWVPGGKRIRKRDFSGELTDGVTEGQRARRLPGPRPSCRDEEMTPEELERRRRRRERNKLAASKCRQRRVDQTNDLLQETRLLEEDSQRLEKEIETLQRLKHQLEFVLEAHKPLCKADVCVNDAATTLKMEIQDVPASIPASRPTSLPIATTTAPSVPTSASQIFFDFPSTGLTPLIDPMALFGSLDGASPSMFLLSPSSLIAQ